MRNKYMLIGVGIVVGVLLASVVVVLAGSVDSPSGPTEASSQMYTLEQIYDRLNGSTVTDKMTSFAEPDTGPGSTMHTLDDIYDLAWPARVPKTGQTATEATGDDGDLEKGVSWPSPRFIDDSGATGVVTDTLTGLIWLKNADCLGTKKWQDGATYPALEAANTLNSGECSLTDGSSEGDWRLPNVRELYSLIHLGQSNSATWLNTQGFSGVLSDFYWSSTTFANDTDLAWLVYLDYGYVYYAYKTSTLSVWPVRGGQ